MNAVAKIEPKEQPIAVVDESAALLAVIERAASNPDMDINKLERIIALREQMLARQAVADFNAALSDMQDELPAIAERGAAKVSGQVRYTFALWEDINTAIKPVLKAHGFALSFRTDFTDGVSVTGVLSHRSGHSEQTTIKLPADASGNKNAVQAVASSVSYGKRYTAGALLNLTSYGEDDDAYSAVDPIDPAWSQSIADAADIATLKKIKADMIANWRGATNIPKELVTAYNLRLDALRETAKHE
jgi:hypothetical protein